MMTAIRIRRQLISLFALITVVSTFQDTAAVPAEEVRYVPQLGLTDLDPVEVRFHPEDGSRLLVVNGSGRIDLFDIANPDRPVKTVEIHAGANDAAFDPRTDRIVSGGGDGTVRLWTLDGQPAAPPLQGHRGGFSSVAFNPAGDRIVAGGDDGTVRLWTLDGQPPAPPLQGHQGAVLSVAFNPTGDRIVSGGDDGTVRLWTLDGQPAAPPLRGHQGAVRSVAFNPTGDRIVSGGDDATVRLWTLDGQLAAAPIEGHSMAVSSVAFNPAGDRIVSGGYDATVRLWTLDGQPAAAPFYWDHEVEGVDDIFVESVAFNPAGDRIVSGGDDGTVQFWTLDGQPAASPFWGHMSGVTSAAFNQAGDRIVSGGYDDTVRLWTLDGQPAAPPFQGHERWVRSVAFNPTGDRIVSGGDDATVRLWTLDGQPAAAPIESSQGWVWSVAFNPAGDRIVSGGEDGTVRLWTLDGQPAAAPFQGHQGAVLSVAFNPTGDRIVSSGEDGTVRLSALDGQAAASPFQGHGNAVRSVAFNPTGDRIVSGGDDGTVRLWTLDGQPAAAPFQGHELVESVAFNPAGDRIVSGGSDGTVLWTLVGQAAAAPLKGHRDGVSSVAFNPTGDRIVSGGDDATVRLWTLDGQPAAALFQGDEEWEWFPSVDFNPAGDRIVSGGADGTVRLWTLDGRPAAPPFQGNEGWVLSVAFNPTGDRIVSGGEDGTVRLWTLDGQLAAAPFQGHQEAVLSVAFNPTGDRIVSGGEDGTVRLWTLDGQLAAAPFQGHQGAVLSVAFNPTGDRIVSGGEDGTARDWNLSSRSKSEVFACGMPKVQRFRTDRWAIRCSDRIVVLDEHFDFIGSVFLHREGLIVVTDLGVLASSDDLHNLVRAFGADGTLLTRAGVVPMLSHTGLRRQLLDDYPASERVRLIIAEAWQRASAFYAELGWLKAPFWPALGWTLVVMSALILWLLAPARLAGGAMPLPGAPPPPPWRWLIGVLTLYGWLGVTRRPLRAWLRRHRDALARSAFSDRRAVRERERYCPLGHDVAMDAFVTDLDGRALLWIDGGGGSGKSALAFQLARTRLIPNPKAPLPVLIDADWDGSLAAEVARQLRLSANGNKPEREPTESMARTLGAMGLLCPVVDSLSERGFGGAVDMVSKSVRDGVFRHLIVTSRKEPPPGPPWEGRRRIHPQPVGRADLPLFIDTYAALQIGVDIHTREQIEERIEPLVRDDPLPSPLFLRFAIEQAAQGPLGSTDRLDLVLVYVEALRAGRIDLDPTEMLRAASITALEACREDGAARELDRLHLRGVLQAEANRMAFLDTTDTKTVEPAAIIDRLVASGLLNPTGGGHRVQFAYDPVAEFLAARWLRDTAGMEALRETLLATDSPVADVFQEIAGR